MRRWKKRNWPRSAISPRSSGCDRPVSRCSISAAAGAGSRLRWRGITAGGHRHHPLARAVDAARRRAAAEGLSDRVRFELIDYRAMTGKFDRIVSVGMFEHVGVAHTKRSSRRCTRPEAGRRGAAAFDRPLEGPGATNPWIAKYIFPGGYSPRSRKCCRPLEHSGLFATDIEILRLHYAKTFAHWRRRFAANRDTIASIYDERFCRMFEFYLSGSNWPSAWPIT